MFENLLNPVFDPLLALPIFWVVMIMALVITLVITVIYKFTTNQSLMKDLKLEIKELQKQVKELRNDPKKMMEVQKKSMKSNMQYMKHSMRSTLFTFIPIILIFGWMNSHLAFEPILPGQEFTTTVSLYDNIRGDIELIVPDGIMINGGAIKTSEGNQVKWVLSGEEGEYLLEYNLDNKRYSKELLITTENTYSKPIEILKDKTVRQISIDNEKQKINWGLFKMGWLGSYIILSIIFSTVLRKLFKVY
ncbi:MAG: EMC3/TMCO1 family protein [Nanoarchaeota archaeon]|nr:EMC3/TMCO1 family protein [Nanoarchaeota archaeon]